MDTVSGTWDNMKEGLQNSLDELLKKDIENKEVIELMIYMVQSPRTKIILKGDDENGS